MNCIAVYGVKGSFSEAAALFFARGFADFRLAYFTEFYQIADAFGRGDIDYAVIPTENSTVGAVAGAKEFIAGLGFGAKTGHGDAGNKGGAGIVADFWQPIIHALMGKHGAKIDNIREVTSHEQALNQCRETLKKINPDLKLTPFDDTAAAAEFVATGARADIAAIAHERCAEIYGLCVLKTAINDNPNNRTHFVAIKRG